MTRDTNSSHPEPKRPPMSDIGPATEPLAQVLAQLREITRKPVRLHAPATRRRWPVPVAVGSCVLLLAGALALPTFGLVPATDMEFLRGKLQVWLGHETTNAPVKVAGNQEP